jgi:hypothetical protein
MGVLLLVVLVLLLLLLAQDTLLARDTRYG